MYLNFNIGKVLQYWKIQKRIVLTGEGGGRNFTQIFVPLVWLSLYHSITSLI